MRRGGGGQIPMKSKKTTLPFRPKIPALEQRTARLVFGRENERNFKMITEFGRRNYLLKREIFDTHHLHRPRHIPQPGPCQFVGRRPRRKHACHWITRLQKSFSILVQKDIVAIPQIVFRRESIWRIPEPRRYKRSSNERNGSNPET